MGLTFSIEVIAFYVLGLVLLYFTGWLLLAPLKILFKLIINAVVGGLVLWGLNLVGGLVSVSIAINPVTALIVGFFGVPGVIMLLMLKVIL